FLLSKKLRSNWCANITPERKKIQSNDPYYKTGKNLLQLLTSTSIIVTKTIYPMHTKKVTVGIMPAIFIIILSVFSACKQQASTESGAIQKSRHVIDTLITSQQI